MVTLRVWNCSFSRIPYEKKIEEIVKLKGCKIKKGEKYINAKTKMIFIDKLGNEFLTTPDRIKKTNWNPPCKK